jgi:exodeoxyribonuclease VII small subunit
MKKSRIPDFEQSMRELEALVEKLEQGDLPLEEALRQFERGVALTRACQAALKEAEQKVEVLLKRSSGEATEPLVGDFEPNGD